jgi:hypothetical protein
LLQLFGRVEVGEQGFLGRHSAFGLGQVGAVIAESRRISTSPALTFWLSVTSTSSM